MASTKENNESARLNALKSYHILDTEYEIEYDRFTRLASLICDTPISTISLIDENRQWFKSKVGLTDTYTSREVSFCSHAIQDVKLFTVRDAQQDERFKNNPLVTGDPNIRFYAGYPITDHNGFNLGTICVIDRKPKDLSASQEEALKILAEEIMLMIHDRRQKEELRNFEKLFNFSNDLFCIANTRGYLERINPAFSVKLGYDHDYFTHTPFMEMVHPDDVLSTGLEIQKLSLGDNSINFTNRFRTKEGKYVYLQWTATPETETGTLFAVARDVTSEKLKEELLIKSETRFRNFFENSQGLMCTHDMDGNFITVNQSGASLLGYTVDEVLGKNLIDIIPSYLHGELKNYLQTVKKDKRATGKMITRHKDGSIRIWMYSNTVDVNDNNEEYVIGNSIDITEQHLLEIEIEKSKERLEQTNKLAKVGAWEIDLVKNVTYWGDITKSIHEVPPDYVPTFEKAIAFYPGENASQMKAVIDKAIATGESYDVEVQIITATGKKRWVKSQGNAEFKDGKCIRLYGAFQDIDDRKKVEIEILKSRKLFDDVLKSAIDVSIIATDTEGIITLFNTGAERMLGYQSSEMVGKQTPAIIHDLDEMVDRSKYLSEKFKEKIEGFDVFTYVARIEGAEESEWTYIKKDGKRIDVSLVVSPIYDAVQSNLIIGYIGIAVDVTEQKKQRVELVKAKQLAEQASIAKSEFLANMSHEIRTPLNGVIGFTDLVLKTDLDDTQSQYISIVNQSANSLLGIINDILDFSKIEAGKLELSIEKADLFELTSQATDIITFQAHSKNLEVLLNVPNSLPRFIYTDNIRLKQILVNLLGNAVKFTTEGEIELSVESLSQFEDEQTFRFKVRDTGIGIHKDKLEKIFEAFAQEDSSTTKKYGGTGLGLTISNKLLGLMNSKLIVESTLGVGSVFYFDVSFKSEYGEIEQWSNAENIKSVLVVDDNKNNRMIVRQMLALNNIQCVEAINGIEAIQILSEGQEFDVIIMDYHMPYLDGIETIKKIRENFQRRESLQPIILLYSSSDDEKIYKACEEYKVNYKMVKPLKMDDLLKAFNNLNVKPKSTSVDLDDAILDSKIGSKILIVEDNTVNLLLSKTLVKKAIPNAIIFEAINGIQAVDKFKSESPDLIFMDIQMPQMNGYEATQLIRELDGVNKTPIIALTAGNVKGEKEKCLAAGMDDFIVKPISQQTISNILSKWLTTNEQLNEISNIPNLQNFDLRKLSDLVDNDPEMVEDLKNQLRIELTNYREELAILIKKPSIQIGKTIAHKLYGMTSTVGMNILAEMAKNMEVETYDKTELSNRANSIITEIDLVLGII